MRVHRYNRDRLYSIFGIASKNVGGGYAEFPSNSAARHSIAADTESAPSAARRSSTITAHLLALLHGAAAGCVVLGLTCATALVLVDVIAGKPTWLWLTKAILGGVAIAVLVRLSWLAHRVIADLARGAR